MYSTNQLADAAGVSRWTFRRWINKLNTANVFHKSTPGKLYSTKDAEKIAQLCGFDLPKSKGANGGKL